MAPGQGDRLERGRRCAPAAPRRASAAACSCPTTPPCSRRGSRSACAGGCSSAAPPIYEHSRVRALTAHAGGVVAETRRRARARGRRGPHHQRRHARGQTPAVAAGRHLVAHRADRAGARRAGGDRLDRGRVDHRRAHVPALLPHHARRPHPLRLGRRAAGGRRTAQRPDRGRRPGDRGDPAPPRRLLPGVARGGRSRTPGAARSTSRRATCRRSARSTTARSTTRSASPATASARRTWPAACWPGWPPATATAGSRSTSPGRRCRRSRWRGLGGMIVRRAFLRAERLQAEGRRPDLLTRAVCAAPRALGIHVSR